MKQQIFGLRKAPIDKLFKKMKHDFSSEITQLEFELGKWKSENNRLEIKIKQKTKETSCDKQEYDLWSLGEQRLERITAVLKDQQEAEMAEIREQYAQAAVNVNEQIEEIDKEMEQAEKLFSDLLQQFMHRFENPNSMEERHHSQVNPIVDDHTLVHNEAAAAAEPGWKDMEEAVACVEPQKNQEKPPAQSSFWSHDGTSMSFDFPDDPIDREFAQVHLKEDSTSQPIEPEKEAIAATDRIAAEPQKDESELDEVLLEQIDSIKTQYIVGKVAGEDLYDFHGNVIVVKNSLITREAVEKANRSGKLADLIVNMKIAEAGVV